MITIKRGQTAVVDFALLATDGSPYDATGCTVTFVADGYGRHFERVGVLPSPSTGVGTFAFAAADYATLRPGRYVVEIWAKKVGVGDPMLSEVLVVDDVPQAL